MLRVVDRTVVEMVLKFVRLLTLLDHLSEIFKGQLAVILVMNYTVTLENGLPVPP